MLLLASGLSLVGFLAYPAALPRLAGIGIADTVSHGPIDINHGLVSSLYNSSSGPASERKSARPDSDQDVGTNIRMFV